MVSIKEGSKADCAFLAKIILLAEESGFEITSYSNMFEKTNEELLPIFEKIINNDTKGHPLTYSSFLIANESGKSCGAIAVYVEGEYGDSNHLTTGALMTNFGRKEMQSAFAFLRKHSELSIPKKSGTLQVDCVATLPEFRGKGMLKSLIAEAERRANALNINEVQIQVWKNNLGAIAAYEKLGYKITEIKLSNSMPEDGKVLMTKNI